MKTAPSFNKSVIALSLFALFHQQVSMAEAIDNDAKESINALEVIEVTSQKRVQSLQDVPASITTVNGDKLANNGITQMEEMSDYVPNFTVSKSGQGYNIYMRGLGSGPNQGFEQTVGTYVDGIYRGRAVLMRSSFLDVDMVEVLRGPQGTLFGMNTTAGALNITSRNATQEFEASVKGYYVPEFNKQDLEFTVSGGLTDDLSARIAMKYESDDGYVENVVTGNDEPQRDNIAARLTLDWNISDKLNANLKIQHDTDEVKGRNLIVTVEPYLKEAGTPQTEALLASLIEYDFDYKSANTTPALGEKQFEESAANHVTLNFSYELSDHTINSVTGWQDYDLDGVKDQDSTARTLIYSPEFNENYQQFSQEFRLTSPGNETFDYIIGAYFQRSDLEYSEVSSVYPLALRGEREFETSSTLWAIFGQFDYQLTDQLTASLGVRYTEEEKDGQRNMLVIDPKTGQRVQESALVNPPALAGALAAFGLPGLPGNAYSLMLGDKFPYLDPLLLGSPTQNIPNSIYGTIDEHSLKDSRKEKSLTPSLTLSYQLNEDTLLYVKGAQGFKSGGFDARSNLGGNFEFEEEEVISMEFGGKLTLDDGAAELNFAVFQMKFNDLQTSVFDGQVGFNVKNAGEATTSGIELDGRWAVLDEITLVGGIGLLDFEWDDFKGAKCFTSNVLVSDNVDETGKSCDLTGETNALVPDVTANIGIEHATFIFDEYELITNIDINYRSDFYTSTDLNPFTEQEAFTKVNMRIALMYEEEWEVALVGKNITDETTRNFSFDLPFTKGGYANMIEPGRSFGVQFRYNFY